MRTIELNGVTLIVTEETAKEIEAELNHAQAELEREREERKSRWMLWHWYARRWAMYESEEDGSIFSDLYKDENGIRPRMSKETIFWIIGAYHVEGRW